MMTQKAALILGATAAAVKRAAAQACVEDTAETCARPYTMFSAADTASARFPRCDIRA
jgi:hypothetical protein